MTPVPLAHYEELTFGLRVSNGSHTVAYQSCDDATAQAGKWDSGKCSANANAYSRNSAVERNGDATRPRGIYWRVAGTGNDLGDIVASNLHFHSADFDLEMLIVDSPRHDAGAPHRFEFDGVTLGNMLDQCGLRVRVSAIRAGRVRDHRRVELLPEFTPHLRDTALRLFGQLLCGGALLNGVDRLPRVIFEIPEKALEFFLHLANFGLLFFLTFDRQAGFFSLQFLFPAP